MARDAKNTDEFFQRIHDVVPGFAGLTFEDGIPTVYLVDPDRADLARSVLTPFFIARGRAGFRVREAEFSWADLYKWRKRARQMFDMPDLRSLSVSTSRNRLMVGIRIGGDAEAALSRLGGTAPFTYLWENDTYSVGTTDSYEGGKLPGSSGSSFVLRFTVSNDAGQSYDEITVTEDSGAPICPN